MKRQGPIWSLTLRARIPIGVISSTFVLGESLPTEDATHRKDARYHEPNDNDLDITLVHLHADLIEEKLLAGDFLRDSDESSMSIF